MRKPSLPALSLVCLVFSLSFMSSLLGQGKPRPEADADADNKALGADTDNPKAREAWFRSGRRAAGEHAADLLHRAYRQKMAMAASQTSSAQRPAVSVANPGQNTASGIPFTGTTYAGTWTNLGPAPIASDPNQDYGKVVGRVTSVAVDQGDASGNTVYIGAAFGGAWKSINAAAANPTTVTWTPIIDDQPTLAVGAVTVQPGTTGNTAVVLIGTGEPNSSGDSYYGMGILRSMDGGNTWTLIKNADNGAKTFTGLGASKFAWSSNPSQPGLVVMGMGSTNGKEFGSDSVAGRGIYYSQDAGQSWHYANVQDPGGATLTEGTVTDVAFNPGTNKFYAFYRYHGFYESTDGVNWTRSTSQPQGSVPLNITNCPTNQATTPNPTGNCPLYRGQIAIQPLTHVMYVIYVDDNDIMQGVFTTTNPDNPGWTTLLTTCPTGTANCLGHLADNSTTNEIVQGDYNLWIGAVPNSTTQGTDLLVGTRNIYKCSLSSSNTNCSSGWMNLTFVYDCGGAPATAAPSHMHPDQHGFDFNIANPLQLYFGNDGGVYRTANGTAISTGICSSPNPFDNLDTNMGSLSEMVSFSQDPKNQAVILGGLQDNGSPATGVSGTSGLLWQIVNGADGGFNEIDPNNTSIWYTEYSILNNSLTIQQCTMGTSCNPGFFGIGPPFPSVTLNITGQQVANDTGEFYTPYIIDTANTSTSTLIVGTCRLWRGPGTGGNTWLSGGVATGSPDLDISPAFDSSATLPCTASGTSTKIRSIAAGGPAPAGISQVIYVGLEGAGTGPDSGANVGHVFVNTAADLKTGTHGAANGWVDVTPNPNATLNTGSGTYGPYPVASIQIDPHDPSGNTAYSTVEGFGVSHVFKTTNAGQTWTDLTNNLPDAPVDSIAIDPDNPDVLYLGTDVGAFISLSGGASWDILGTGLPNVPVTKIRVFGRNAHQPKLLRVSTYGRGVWQFTLNPPPPADVSPNPLAFGNQLVKTSATQTVTFTNNSGSPITFTSSATLLTGTDFSIQSNSCPAAPNTLANFAACQIQIAFAPQVTGAQSNTLTITDTATNSPQTVPVSGTGVVAGISLSPTSITNFTADVGSQSAAQIVTVTSISSGATTITVGAMPSGFTQTNNCSTLQTTSATCTINVVFAPTPTSTNNGTFTVTDSASGVPLTETLSGIASDFQIAAGASTNSLTVTAGQPATYNLNLSGTNSGFSGTVSLACSSGVPANASCTFSPSASVNVSGTTMTAVTLTISTTAHSAAQPTPPSGSLGPPLGGIDKRWLVLFGLGITTLLVLTQLKPQRPPTRAFALLVLIGTMALAPACGGGGGGGGNTTPPPPNPNSGTPAGNYTVTVTATAGNRSQQIPLMLKVN